MAVFATRVVISFAVMVRMVVRRFGAIGRGARWVLL